MKRVERRRTEHLKEDTETKDCMVGKIVKIRMKLDCLDTWLDVKREINENTVYIADTK